MDPGDVSGDDANQLRPLKVDGVGLDGRLGGGGWGWVGLGGGIPNLKRSYVGHLKAISNQRRIKTTSTAPFEPDGGGGGGGGVVGVVVQL